MKGLRIGLVAVVVTTATWMSAPPASAETILYEQMAVPASTNGILSYADPNDPTKASEGADDFTVPSGETWTVTSVEVFGSSYVDDVADDFVVNVYADDGGAPAGLLETRAAVGTLLGPITGIVAEHRLALATPLLLTEGTYWLGVQAQATDGFTFWHWVYDEGDRGAEAQWRNPGGGLGMGCSEFTAITTCRDDGNGLTFRLLSATAGVLSFGATAVSVDEDAGTVALEVVRTGGSAGEVSVTVVSGAVTAQPVVDYVSVGEVVSFAAGETSKTVEVSIVDDAIFEGDETFNVFLSGATGGATIAGGQATVTITDDEVSGFQFASATFDVEERYAPNGRATVTVTRSGDLSGAATVDYATSDGTALAAKDYVASSGTLSFAPGEASKTFSVRILRDTSTEGTETVTLTLTNPSAGAGLATPNPATLNIND